MTTSQPVTESRAIPKAEPGAPLLARAAHAASVPLLLTNHRLEYVELNDAAAAFLGYERDELLNMTVDQIVAQRDPDELMRASRDLKRQRFRAGSTGVTRKTGETVAVNFISAYAGRDRILTLLWPL